MLEAQGKSLIFQDFHQMEWLAYFRPSVLVRPLGLVRFLGYLFNRTPAQRTQREEVGEQAFFKIFTH
ncbi:MAG: hypothetical protein ACHBN1_19550 [Heteroscytonema crispum UTEX LB 1556]